MTTTAPSADAPGLTRAQTDYMALTAPEDDEPSVEDLFHIYRKAERESLLAADPKRSYYARADMLAGVQAVRDAAIAAAEPHLRTRHRAELFAELADEARSWAKEAEDRGAFLIAQSHLTLAMRFENRPRLEANADATRPVEGRGDR